MTIPKSVRKYKLNYKEFNIKNIFGKVRGIIFLYVNADPLLLTLFA
jgi:hypothetical protein